MIAIGDGRPKSKEGECGNGHSKDDQRRNDE
jgi:hypothetical protein